MVTSNDTVVVLPWVKPKDEGYAEAIKWQQANTRYEIHSRMLTEMELELLLPHCLDVRRKVNSVVATDNHIGPSLFQVFERTLSTVLKSIWDVIVDAGAFDENQEGFDQALRLFISSHCTAEDRHELVQQLLHPQKPRDLNVQTFYYRLLELNSYVEWMPGTDASLTEDQIRQALYDGMPSSWRDRFINAGKVVSDLTIAEHTRYFRQQEKLSIRKQNENTCNQCRESKSQRRTPQGSPKFSKKTNGSKPSVSFKDKGSTGSKKVPSNSDPCPFHEGHVWGECTKNAYNPNREETLAKLKARRANDSNKQRKGNNGDGFAVESNGEHGSSASDDSSQEDVMDSDDSVGPTLPKGRIPRKKKQSKKKSKLPSAGDLDDCSSLNIDSHHIDNVIPIQGEDVEIGQLATEMSDCFMSYLEDCYLTGEEAAISKELVNVDPIRSLKLKPIGLMLVKKIQGIATTKPLKVLFDSGSDQTFINRRALPRGAVSRKASKPLRVKTINGKKAMDQTVRLKTLGFPEFSATLRVDKEFTAFVFDRESTYDVILGLDIMVPLGIDISCDTQTMTWNDNKVPWKPRHYFDDSILQDPATESAHCFAISDAFEEAMDEILDDCYFAGAEIKESLYDTVSTQEVLDSQKHLQPLQLEQLGSVLERFTGLFNGDLVTTGKLGKFKGPKVHLELLPDAQSVRQQPYPVPHSQRKVFKAELDRLCRIGVLEKTGPSEWLSPTFIIPKKDGRVRWVSDFRKLNKWLKRKVYQLPRIQDILKKRSGYKYFTKIDISMQYYAFELDEPSKNLCTICTPFGNYRYTRCAMGIKQSPDIAQSAMEDLMRGIEEVDVYINDVGIFSNSWEEHVASVTKVLSILQSANFTVNPLKCEWGVQETDWLGYWLTPRGLKPWKKKIDAILRLLPPATMKQLRSFIGAVTFYRDMFRKRSHILAPLTKLVGQKVLKWTDECQKAFDAAKAMIAKRAFLAYPDHNKPFHVYCDASDLQLGSAILQDDTPVAFYSRKLSKHQTQWTVGEKEMLSIVETLKEFRTMLYGCQELHLHTDHKNLLYESLASQRVTRWRLFVKEFSPYFHYIKGENNTLADALLRLPCSERQSTDRLHPSDQYTGRKAHVNNDPEDPLKEYYSMAIDDDDLLDCFVHLPAQAGLEFALDYQTIAEAQDRDAELQELANNQPQRYVRQLLAPNTWVYCHISEPGAPWKIHLPNELLQDTVRYYHLALSHVGNNRLLDTISLHFYNRALKGAVEQLVSTCDPCQRYKQVGRGHGETAPKEAGLVPWQEVAVDLIGPWELTVGEETRSFIALTVIDLVTNLTEVVRLENKSAAHVALQFENTWLARYPRPLHIVYDQGGEFTGYHFQQMLARHNIQKHPISAKNPQANSVCERMHQSIGNSLRVLTNMNPPQGIAHANQLVDTAIANAMYATRATVHSALKTTPGSVAFGQDMMLDIPIIADLETIRERRQQLINDRLIAANRKRFSYDYAIGDEVLKLSYKPNKLDPRASGPFRIERVHANGTLTIRVNPFTIERISLRRVKPYRR